MLLSYCNYAYDDGFISSDYERLDINGEKINPGARNSMANEIHPGTTMKNYEFLKQQATILINKGFPVLIGGANGFTSNTTESVFGHAAIGYKIILSKCYCNFSCLETHSFTIYNDNFLKCRLCGHLKKKTGFMQIIKTRKEEDEEDEEV